MSGPYISLFDLFKIGIGPSSSHTVGPMKAAREFAQELDSAGLLGSTHQIQTRLYGSLALTGIGHGTDKALLAGLEGFEPATVDPDHIRTIVDDVRQKQTLKILGKHEVNFIPSVHMEWLRNQNLPEHPNGMNFQAFDANGTSIMDHNYYSIGGGFITRESLSKTPSAVSISPVPFVYTTAQALLDAGEKNNLSISEITRRNELAFLSERELDAKIDEIIQAMRDCIERGLKTSGSLPGGLKVRRRAFELHQALLKAGPSVDPLVILDWVNVFALAVNEENASFGRVVTAPTNGAAGIIPAVLEYYIRFVPSSSPEGARKFLLTASAIGTLYKINASISGAEVGCQGEVGVASSMAAAALADVLGGTNEQIENAAEIAMEHHLGMTCDPVGGLVQIPCIERNAMGAVKAINAARIALRGDGKHTISLDQVIKTMWETGQDMSTKYKETSRGGLALNIPEC